MRRRTRWLLLAPLVGCAGAPSSTTGLSRGETTTTTGDAQGTASDASTNATASTSTSTTGESESADGSTAAPLVDVGVDTGEVDTVPLGCLARKIDFVFLISRSASMSPFETAVAAAIPGFLAVIDDDLAAFDPHLMVIDNQESWGEDSACTFMNCPIDGGCDAVQLPEYPCWALHDPAALSPCDRSDGAGVVFPAGRGAANEPCPFLPGRRYLSREDPDLAGAFACAAKAGTLAHKINISEELYHAFTPQLTGPKGCNAGFLRDDALLVLTILHSDLRSPGPHELQPIGWAEQIHAAKGGDRDAIIALGIVPDTVDGVREPLCKAEESGPPDGGAAHEFLGYFDHALTRSICAPDLVDGFAAAAARVQAICDGAAE